MRQVLLSFLFLLGCGSFCSAQNLVPNPSFEDTLECPDFPGQVWRAQGWYVAENTPDYYNCCCNTTFPICGVPQNQFAFRYAATGIAYCGIYTYLNYPPTDFQEKIGIELSSPLEVGIHYYASMKVSSVNTYVNQVSNGGHNKLGILFSTNKYDMNNRPPNNNFAQFYSDSIITDTTGWATIKGSFIADSAYRFLTIGNFFDNSHVDTIRYFYINGNNGLVAYYFVDDVCVTTDNNGCDFTSIPAGECSYTSTGEETTQYATPIAFPNPFTNELNVRVNTIFGYSVKIFNSLGIDVLETHCISANGQIKINTQELATGIYYLQVNYKGKYYTQNILKIIN